MLYYIDEDPRPPIHAIVIESEAAMLEHLDIYRNPDTRFHVRTWSRECDLTPLALAVEMMILLRSGARVLFTLSVVSRFSLIFFNSGKT